MHLTLRFVGEVPRDVAGDIDERLVAERARGVGLHIQGVETFGQGAKARELRRSQDVVGEEDVRKSGFGHDLGLAELLAGDAPGACGDLHLCEQWRLMRLDVRAVGDAGCIADRLHARDVGGDAVHIDHEGGRADLAGDLGGEGYGHRLIAPEVDCSPDEPLRRNPG